jgi:hypothetical protein
MFCLFAVPAALLECWDSSGHRLRHLGTGRVKRSASTAGGASQENSAAYDSEQKAYLTFRANYVLVYSLAMGEAWGLCMLL